MLHAGEVLQNRYEILKIIGKGGMSTVYQARDLTTGNLLAVKDVERSGKNQNQIVEQSLAAEGRMLKNLSNPHLPKIYDIIENQNNFMLVMDFIQGESLDKVIARTGAQNVDQVLDWGIQICDVFYYLHNQPIPIIYRDMKPANVMVQPDGKLMMIDFGTARTQKVGVEMQADTVCIGTAGFAAPEQFGGIGQSTARTDIFCLGATLYNLVTGHSPCEKPIGILPLEQWNPALANSPIAEIIYKCTRNDPNDRYQTAWELREDLRMAKEGMFRKGKSGNLGGMRRAEWQKQDVQGKGIIAEGLSGLLNRTRSGATGTLPGHNRGNSGKLTEEAPKVQGSTWQQPVREAQIANPVLVQPSEEPMPEQENPNELIQKLTIIAMLVAGIFFILTVVLALFQLIGASMAFLVIALIAAGCGVAGLLHTRR